MANGSPVAVQMVDMPGTFVVILCVLNLVVSPAVTFALVKMVSAEIARNGHSAESLRKDGPHALFLHVGDHQYLDDGKPVPKCHWY